MTQVPAVTMATDVFSALQKTVAILQTQISHAETLQLHVAQNTLNHPVEKIHYKILLISKAG